jgi:hypothetical protein
MVHSMVLRRLALVLSALLLAVLLTHPVQAQDAVAVDITITSATIDATGTLIVTTTLTCSEPAEAFVRADASQEVKRNLVFGSGEASDLVACGPTGTTVVVPIAPQVGAFQPGRVNVIANAFVCAPDFAICSSGGSDSEERTLPVRRAA